MPAADTAGCLNVLCYTFRLAIDDHQSKSWNINANAKHIGCKNGIERVSIWRPFLEILQYIDDLVLRKPRREFLRRPDMSWLGSMPLCKQSH